MHIFTTILAWLAMVLAAVAIYPVSQIAKKRNAITETIVAEKNKRDKNIEELASARITRAKELEELNRLMEGWGRLWTAKGQTDPATASLLLNIGTAQGLAAQEVAAKRQAPVVYVFHTQPDGSSRYLGEFRVVTPEAQRTILQLNRKPNENETAEWPPQGDFRIRDRIPPGHRAIFHDLATNQAIADQAVINETAKLQIQENHIAASQKTLDRRLAELNGDPAAPQTAGSDVVNGLVETLRQEEAARNKLLADVDVLRRQLSDNYARLEKVLAENSQSVEALATGTETANAAGTGAR
jgi:uncharacterized protein YqiB (DUF1249 family)